VRAADTRAWLARARDDLRGAESVAVDATLKPHLRATAPLTEYAWQYRYPGEPSEPEESEVRQALDRARAVVALVLGRVPAEAHP